MTQEEETLLKIRESEQLFLVRQVSNIQKLGLMGIPIAALLGKIGSRLIMPVSNKN